MGYKRAPEAAVMGIGYTERPMARTVWNEIHEAAVEAGLRPSDLDHTERAFSAYGMDVTVPVVRHKPTGSYFVFDGTLKRIRPPASNMSANVTEEVFLSIYHPALKSQEARAEDKTFHAQLTACKGWLRLVKVEDDATDLWEASRPIADDELDISNEPFTDPEKAELKTALKRIESRLIELSPAAKADAAEVRIRIEYLTKAADRVMKLDWLFIARTALGQLTCRYLLERAGFYKFMDYCWKEISVVLLDGQTAIEGAIGKFLGP